MTKSGTSDPPFTNFSLSYIDNSYCKYIPFIWLLLKAYSFDNINIFFMTPATSEKILNICNKIVLYHKNLDNLFLLSDWQNSFCKCFLVAVVVLCLLSYTRSKQSNILQIIVEYISFANNIFKCVIEMFHQIKLAIFYKSIYCAFHINANTMEREIREKVMTYWLFIFYNNMNFYEYLHNTCIFNQRA